MTWDSLAAVGSIASAVVLAVASIAALVQIRHFRLATQLECYLETMREINQVEMVEARTFIRNMDFTDARVLDKILSPQLDARVGKLMTALQTVSRLFKLGILDEEMMVVPIGLVVELWPRVFPIVQELRRRTGLPYLTDAEYLVYRVRQDRTIEKLAKRYPKEFMESSGLGALWANNQALAEGSAAPPI